MKRFESSLLLCCFLIAACTPSSRESNEVYWKRSSTGSLSIKKIQMTDSVTTLICDVSQWSSWSLASTVHLAADGKSYALCNGKLFVRPVEGEPCEVAFQLDSVNDVAVNHNKEEHYRPDSLMLFFEPLPISTVTFDLIEKDSLPNKGWALWGVRTDGKTYPKQLKKSKAAIADGELPLPVLKYGKATLRGRILGFSKDMDKYIGYYYKNPFTGEFDLNTKVDSVTGEFLVETYLFRPTKIGLSLPGFSASVVMSPGSEQVLDYDIAALCEKNVRKSNNSLAADNAFEGDFCFGGDLIAINEAQNRIGGYPTLVDDLKRYLGISFEDYKAEIWDTLQARKNRFEADTRWGEQQREWNIMNAEMVYTTHFIDYLSRMGAGLYFSDLDTEAGMEPYRKRFSLVNEHAKELSFLQDIRSLYFLDIGSYSAIMEYMRANGLQGNEVYRWLEGYEKAVALASKINLMEPIAHDSVLLQIDESFRPKLKAMNDSLQVSISTDHAGVKNVPDVAPEKLIGALVKSYPGKAVFFDFWATWCGPCRKGIAAMEPMKKELEGKDVVFVYLTNETSPIKDYLKMIQDIPGEHYRMKNSVWNALSGVGGGIPYYLLYDKQGKLIMKQTGWGDESLPEFKTKIEQAIGR